MSEILDKEVEIRAAAEKCATLQDLARHFNWHMQTAMRANDIHRLGLDIHRKSRPDKPRQKKECPKPVGKGSKPAAKGEA